MSIAEKVGAIQSELKAPKSQVNRFGNYRYRSCEDILEAVKPLLKKHKASLVINDEIVLIGDRYYVKASAIIMDNETEGYLKAVAYAREEDQKKGMDASQLTGATSSYARKYALNGLFAIDDSKDSDATNDHGKVDTQADMPEEEKADTSKKVSKTYLDYLNRVLSETGSDVDAFLTYMEIDKLEDMTVEQFTVKAKPTLEKKAKAKK